MFTIMHVPTSMHHNTFSEIGSDVREGAVDTSVYFAQDMMKQCAFY